MTEKTSQTITKDKAREIRKRLDSAGIAVRSLGSPYGKIGVRDDFEPHLDNFRRSLETAEIDHPQVLE